MADSERLIAEARERAGEYGASPYVTGEPPLIAAEHYAKDVPALCDALEAAERRASALEGENERLAARNERLLKEVRWLAEHPSLPRHVHYGATYGVYLMAGDVQRVRDLVSEASEEGEAEG